MTNEEGGIDPDESLYEVLVDRVNTTATVWLGTTLGCAQCHNHKYDPFSQKDYFRLLAFFANPAYETQRPGDGTRYSEARLDLATPEQAARAQRGAGRDQAAREACSPTTTPALAERAARAGRPRSASAERAWTALAPRDATRPTASALDDAARRLDPGVGPEPRADHLHRRRFETQAEGLTGVRLEALPDPSLPRGGPGRDAYGHFRVTGLSVSIAPLAGGTGAARRRCAIETIQRRRRRRAVRAGRSARRRRRRRAAAAASAAPGGSTRCARRRALPRHAVLTAGRAVRVPRRHARHRAHRPGGRHDRPGHRPLPPGGDDAPPIRWSGRRCRRRCGRCSCARRRAIARRTTPRISPPTFRRRTPLLDADARRPQGGRARRSSICRSRARW